MKTKKIIAGVTALALVGTCGVALTACGGNSTTSSVKTYTIVIDGKDYADWKAENEQPLDMGNGHLLWGIDTWATGTKLAQDDDGNPVGAEYKYTLDIDENCIFPKYVAYTLSYSAYIPASEAYSEPSTLVYSYQGFAYEIEGGYHLLAPNYAEGFMASQCLSETIAGGGMGEGAGASYAETKGPNGGTVKYVYTNSNLQTMGATYDVPFMSEILYGMTVCDVKISGSNITEFVNYNEYAVAPNIPEQVIVVPGTGGEGGEVDEDELIQDDDVDYSFAPGWATGGGGFSEETSLEEDQTVTIKAGAYNTFMMGDTAMGWNNVEVTFTFHADEGKTVTIEMLNNQGKTDTYTGTYKVFMMMQNYNYVIQLDNIAGSENPMTGAIEGAVDWSTVPESDAGVKGAQVGMNIFYWISKDGKIVLSKQMGGDGYQFNVAQGGGAGGGEQGGSESN